jgi:DNA repair exonuclease SbcCD ATPase subunit
MLKSITDYQVDIDYNKVNEKIEMKKVVDGKVTNINLNTLSGGESFIFNLCFKMALTRHNPIKTNFYIIDERFQFVDSEFIENLPKLFDYFRKFWKFVLIISHDEKIIKLYDQHIYTNVRQGVSNINFENYVDYAKVKNNQSLNN